MSTDRKKYDDKLSVRVRSNDLTSFKEHCRTKLLRNYQDVLREVITAINEGRCTITPTKDQQQSMKEIYNEH